MNTRTVILPLVNNSATSAIIGRLASQQRLAYNQAANIINREPNIPKRARKGSTFGLNKRITKWRKENPDRATAPYHIHQQGSETAFQANELMRFHQMEREERIAKVIENDEQPHPRDTKPHRRTLAHRSRKHGTSTLTIRGAQFIRPSGRYTFTITGVDHIFRTRRELPDNIVTMQFVELPERRRSANAPLKTRPLPTPRLHKMRRPGARQPRGRHHRRPPGHGRRHQEPLRVLRRHPLLRHGTLPSPKATPGTTLHPGQAKNSKSRRHAELLHLTKNRKRSADKQRQTNAAVIEQLDTAQPAAVAVEGKQVSKLMRSARGRGRRRKAGLNRALADVTLGKNQRIVANQAQKRGIHIIPIPAPGTSQTCPRCGYRHRETAKAKRASGVTNANGVATPTIRQPSSSATAVLSAPRNVSTDTPRARTSPQRGGRNSHPARDSPHCCPGLKARPSRSATRRSRPDPTAGNGQGPGRQAGLPRSSVPESLMPGPCSHQTARDKLWKPGQPKVHKHVCYEAFSSVL